MLMNIRTATKAAPKALLVAGFLALAACGGKGDDSLGDNVADAYENAADNAEAQADATGNEAQAEALENKADALEETGEAKEEAIDDADVNAQAVTPEQVNAMKPH